MDYTKQPAKFTTAKPTELKVGDWFIDPHRAGRRPARVVEIGRIGTGSDGIDRLHMTLDDDTKWGAWAASYELGEDLERC